MHAASLHGMVVLLTLPPNAFIRNVAVNPDKTKLSQKPKAFFQHSLKVKYATLFTKKSAHE